MMDGDHDYNIELDSDKSFSISETSMNQSEDESQQQDISEPVKSKPTTIEEPRRVKRNKDLKDNPKKPPVNYKPAPKGSSTPITSGISESSASQSQPSTQLSDGHAIEILSGGSKPSESHFGESNEHSDYVPNEHTDSIWW